MEPNDKASDMSIPGPSVWDLWWTKWHWDRFFPLSVSFHRCTITRKNEKTQIIFITELHNKRQGCGALLKKILYEFCEFQEKLEVMVR
jgi:hypothetical protein